MELKPATYCQWRIYIVNICMCVSHPLVHPIHAVFRIFWPNNRSVPLAQGPPLSEILDPSMCVDRYEVQQTTACCWLKSFKHVEACYHISLTAVTIYPSAITWNSWTKTGLTIRKWKLNIGGGDENYNIAHFLTLRAVSFSAVNTENKVNEFQFRLKNLNDDRSYPIEIQLNKKLQQK